MVLFKKRSQSNFQVFTTNDKSGVFFNDSSERGEREVRGENIDWRGQSDWRSSASCPPLTWPRG